MCSSGRARGSSCGLDCRVRLGEERQGSGPGSEHLGREGLGGGEETSSCVWAQRNGRRPLCVYVETVQPAWKFRKTEQRLSWTPVDAHGWEFAHEGGFQRVGTASELRAARVRRGCAVGTVGGGEAQGQRFLCHVPGVHEDRGLVTLLNKVLGDPSHRAAKSP